MGLIDVLTQYDTKKKAAHAAKTVKHGVSNRKGRREKRHCCQMLETFSCTCMEGKPLMFSPMSFHETYGAQSPFFFFNLLLFVSISSLSVSLQAGAEISTVHPEQYAKRFRDFISNIFA